MKKIIALCAALLLTTSVGAQFKTKCQAVEFVELQSMSDVELGALQKKYWELVMIPVEPGSRPSMLDEYRAYNREIERVTAMIIKRKTK